MRLLGIVIFSLVLAALPALGAGAENPTRAAAFVTLPPLHVPVFEGDTVMRQASLVVALELEEGRAEADVEPLSARLVDAFLSDLTLIFERRVHVDRLIDPQIIKPALLETANRVLGPGIVRDVLIQQAMERSRRR